MVYVDYFGTEICFIIYEWTGGWEMSIMADSRQTVVSLAVVIAFHECL